MSPLISIQRRMARPKENHRFLSSTSNLELEKNLSPQGPRRKMKGQPGGSLSSRGGFVGLRRDLIEDFKQLLANFVPDPREVFTHVVVELRCPVTMTPLHLFSRQLDRLIRRVVPKEPFLMTASRFLGESRAKCPLLSGRSALAIQPFRRSWRHTAQLRHRLTA